MMVAALLMCWLLYVLYVLTMGVYRAYLAGRLNFFAGVMLSPLVLVAAMFDVVCQLTIASVVFLEPPPTRWQSTTLRFWRWSFDVSYLYVEPLVTTRLKRLHSSDKGWRAALAAYVCQNLLDPFDPNGDHC